MSVLTVSTSVLTLFFSIISLNDGVATAVTMLKIASDTKSSGRVNPFTMILPSKLFEHTL
ncbi:hypothetical protein GCM10023151_22810 [Kangiella marina]|uniref:Uncharacterized protein n=1 Tax=Kangiella marina TaxID=1079178 RepID=A0ABP8IPQ3_9GAMM